MQKAECRRQNAELLKSFAFGKTQMSFRLSEKTSFIVHCALCIVHSQFVVRSPLNCNHVYVRLSAFGRWIYLYYCIISYFS